MIILAIKHIQNNMLYTVIEISNTTTNKLKIVMNVI